MAFGFETTSDAVLLGQDLTGKRAVVTGVSAGLGVETARALTEHGATVIGTARDLAKARGATAHIANLELVQMDLASLTSVAACADALLKRGEAIDLLICNAGVMACPEGRTQDGFETQFGTNHVGHFVFVNRLLPLLRDGSRVVILSSYAHHFGDVDLDDPDFADTPYHEWIAYGRSKTANALFAVELDRRLRDRGIRATAVHPGGIRTELSRHLTPESMTSIAELRASSGARQLRPTGSGDDLVGRRRGRPRRGRRAVLRGLRCRGPRQHRRGRIGRQPLRAGWTTGAGAVGKNRTPDCRAILLIRDGRRN